MPTESQTNVAFAEIQRRFAAAVLSGAVPSADANADIRAGALLPARRIEIYQHNVFTNLSNALADLYPIVLNIVGEPFFRQAALGYCRAVESRSGDLNDFGEAFGDFLCYYPAAAELPYLPEVARLEWRWHRAFHAADAADGADSSASSLITRLAAVDPEHLGGLLLALHPSAAVLSSIYPLFDIWQVNQPDYEGSFEINWDGEGGSVLLYRDGFEVALRVLTPGEASFLVALSRAETLAVALEMAVDQEAEFNLQGFLLECVQYNIIINFRTPP